MFSDWLLSKIEIKDDIKTYVFICEQWLGKKEGDGKIERILFEKVNKKNNISLFLFFLLLRILNL